MRAYLAYLAYLLVVALTASPVALMEPMKISGPAAWAYLVFFYLAQLPLSFYWVFCVVRRSSRMTHTKAGG